VYKLRFRSFFNCWCNNLHNKPDHLLSRNILLKWVFDLYELPCWILCRKRWIHKLCCLPCWVILRHDGIVSGDWKLRRWQVFSCLSHRMLVLLGWNLHFDCISIKLHELFHGHFRRVSWIECMHGLHSWVILRHCRIVSSDWKLRCWQVFSCISHRMLILLGWNLHFEGISIKLLELFHGHFRRVCWIKCMYCLHSWVILRYGRIVSSDWQLCRWQVFSCISHRMLVLLGWNLHFDCISIKLFELF